MIFPEFSSPGNSQRHSRGSSWTNFWRNSQGSFQPNIFYIKTNKLSIYLLMNRTYVRNKRTSCVSVRICLKYMYILLFCLSGHKFLFHEMANFLHFGRNCGRTSWGMPEEVFMRELLEELSGGSFGGISERTFGGNPEEFAELFFREHMGSILGKLVKEIRKIFLRNSQRIFWRNS